MLFWHKKGEIESDSLMVALLYRANRSQPLFLKDRQQRKSKDQKSKFPTLVYDVFLADLYAEPGPLCRVNEQVVEDGHLRGQHVDHMDL